MIEWLRARRSPAVGDSGTPRASPFAYRVEDWRGRHLAVTRSLAAAAAAARQTGLHPDDIEIHAVFDGNRAAPVPADRYSRKTTPTREEAIAFIVRRNERTEKDGLARFIGIGRCRPEDPFEKQIADYLGSAPREWLPVLVIAVSEVIGVDPKDRA